jgi:hypothetical protein
MNHLKLRIFTPRFRRIFLGLLGGLCFVLLLGLPHRPAIAQINQARVREILDGNQVYIEQKQAVVNDLAQLRQKIRTAGTSRAGLTFNNGAAGRLGRNASLIVGQCVEVERGQLVVSGPANGCLSGFSVAVQGTMYVMERDPENKEKLGTFTVLEKAVQIKKQDADETVVPTRVNQGQRVSILPNGELGPIENITPEEFADTLNGPLFEGYQEPLPTQSNLQGVCQTLYSNYDCTIAGVPVARNEPIRGLW